MPRNVGKSCQLAPSPAAQLAPREAASHRRHIRHDALRAMPCRRLREAAPACRVTRHFGDITMMRRLKKSKAMTASWASLTI